MKQPLGEFGAFDFNAVRQDERPLELAGRDSAMEINTLVFLGLPAANNQLTVLEDDIQVVMRKNPLPPT